MSYTACYCYYEESVLTQGIFKYYQKTLSMYKTAAVAATDETLSDVSQESGKILVSLISYLFVACDVVSFGMLSDSPSALNMLYVGVISRTDLSAALNHSFHQRQLISVKQKKLLPLPNHNPPNNIVSSNIEVNLQLYVSVPVYFLSTKPDCYKGYTSTLA